MADDAYEWRRHPPNRDKYSCIVCVSRAVTFVVAAAVAFACLLRMGWVPDAQRSVLDQLLTLLLRDTAVGKHNITARLRHQQSPTPISSLSATDTKEIEASMKKWRQHEQKWQHQQHPQHPQHQQYQQHKQQSSPAVRHWRQQHSSSAAINGTSSATRPQYACVLHGNSKHPTQTRTERQPRIVELTNELYLFTFILTGDGLMLRHWLQHYHRRIVPERTRAIARTFALRQPRGSSRSSMSLPSPLPLPVMDILSSLICRHGSLLDRGDLLPARAEQVR